MNAMYRILLVQVNGGRMPIHIDMILDENYGVIGPDECFGFQGQSGFSYRDARGYPFTYYPRHGKINYGTGCEGEEGPRIMALDLGDRIVLNQRVCLGGDGTEEFFRVAEIAPLVMENEDREEENE